MEFHEVGNFRVGFDLPSSFCSLSPGGMISWGFPFSSFPRVSSVFGRVASLFVADEAFLVSDVFCPFTGREIDLVYVHGVRIWSRGPASWRDIAVSSSSEFSKLHYISVEFPGLIKPLFPLPTSLSIREGGGSHHDGELLGYPSLKGVYQDAIVIDPTAYLGQFKGSGVLVKVSIELIHVEGIDGLAGLVFKIFWNEGFFESLA